MAVSYSTRYDRNRYNPSLGCPTSRMLQLWKSTVLPHYLLHLRYACTPALVDELQASLTRSLETCLHVFGEKTAILAETGVPPLFYTQHVQLAQFSFRLRHHTHLVIPHFLWSHWASRLSLLPPESLDRRMPASTRFLDPDRLDNPSILPRCVASAKEAHREKSYQRYLQSRVTSKWRLSLQQEAENGRMLSKSSRYLAYIALHLGDLSKRTSVYKAAHYLRSPFPAQQDLLRLRAQAWSLVLPCHQWRLAARGFQRQDYANRFCPLCLPHQHLGTEAHMIIDCPHTNCVWIQFLDKFKRLARLLDLPPLVNLAPPEQLQFALGNPPPQLLKKQYRLWLEITIPVCIEFARALRHHIAPLLSAARLASAPGNDSPRPPRKRKSSGAGGPASSAAPSRPADPPAPPTGSAPIADSGNASPTSESEESEYSSPDEDENNDPSIPSNALPLPPGFSIADSDFLTDEHFEIRQHNPAASALVNRYILYRWAGVGWCVGLIVSRHTREVQRHKTAKGFANFVVHYECDDTTAQHTLCFDSYNDDESAKSPVSTWVLLDKA